VTVDGANDEAVYGVGVAVEEVNCCGWVERSHSVYGAAFGGSDGGEVVGKGNVGSAEWPLDNVPEDRLSGIEACILRTFCEWNDVVVLAGLEMDGGVATSCEDAGVVWLDGDCTTNDSSVLYALRHAATKLLYKTKADATPGHLSAASTMASNAMSRWRLTSSMGCSLRISGYDSDQRIVFSAMKRD
jgi:hypothetical protein